MLYIYTFSNYYWSTFLSRKIDLKKNPHFKTETANITMSHSTKI